ECLGRQLAQANEREEALLVEFNKTVEVNHELVVENMRLQERLNALLSGRMDEAEAKIGTRPAHVVVGELEADNILLRRENERLRFVAERVVRANKDVENHGYAPLRRLIR